MFKKQNTEIVVKVIDFFQEWTGEGRRKQGLQVLKTLIKSTVQEWNSVPAWEWQHGTETQAAPIVHSLFPVPQFPINYSVSWRRIENMLEE